MAGLRFKDFAPEEIKTFMSLKRQYETTGDLLGRVDEWLAETGVEVVNCETVVLPGKPSKDEGALSTSLEIEVGAFGMSSWYQLVRVWYRAPAAPLDGATA